jgi:hypothetical protein
LVGPSIGRLQERAVGVDARSMLSFIRSNAVGFVALFVALSGSAYAAINLPAGSVGTQQLRNGAVTGSKVRPGSLYARDFRPGQLPRGAQGPQGVAGPPGAPGAQGVPGTARAYALVTYTGSFAPGLPHPGFTGVTNPSTGFYCLTTDGSFSPSQYPAVVSADYDWSPDQFIGAEYRDTTNGSPICTAGQYEVVTVDMVGQTPSNEGFSIIVP